MYVTGWNFNKPPCSSTGYNDSDDDSQHPLMCEMLGNFNYDVLQGKQLRSIIMLAKFFYMQNKPIRFHNELYATACPGTSISKEWFMSMVESKCPDIIGHWAEEYIRKVLESGKMNGYDDGNFHPDEPLTRAQMAKLIVTLGL